MRHGNYLCHVLCTNVLQENSGHHVDRTALVTLEVARNHHNFRCARSQVAILLASLISINSRRRQSLAKEHPEKLGARGSDKGAIQQLLSNTLHVGHG